MKQNYLISIVGRQKIDGEEGEIELTTVGSYVTKGDIRYILYDEYDEDNPSIKTTSILKINDNKKVTLIKKGRERSRLLLEKGKRHQCIYDTGMGTMTIGVFANTIDAQFTDQGGTLEIGYTLDINSGLTSLNKIFIKVKGTNKQNVKDSAANN